MPSVECEYCKDLGRTVILYRSQRRIDNSATGLFFCSCHERDMYAKKHGLWSKWQDGVKRTRVCRGPALKQNGVIHE